MLRWGSNRREAARNYTTHFKSPCNWCIDLYTDLIAQISVDRMDEEGIDPNSPRVNELLQEVHSHYLGSSTLCPGFTVRLDDLIKYN
jgi:hypothetical protein